MPIFSQELCYNTIVISCFSAFYCMDPYVFVQALLQVLYEK